MRVPFLAASVMSGVLAGQPTACGQLANLARVSVDSAGLQANGDSHTCALSADGNWVAFASAADNLAADDRNDQTDIYLHDRRTGATTRVSVSNAGAEAELESVQPAVSADGRLVAFQSDAANLVDGDTNGFPDIFVRDTQLGTTSRVSLGQHDEQAALPCVEPALSDDGRFVAFLSYATNLGGGSSIGVQDVFVRDLLLGTTDCVSHGPHGQLADKSSWSPSLSADGRYVAFVSQASNLVAGDVNGSHDVFVFDRQMGVTELASLSSEGAPGYSPSLRCQISGDGRFVVFTSYAINLIPSDNNFDSDILLRDRLTGTTELVSQSTLGRIGNDESDYACISSDGRFVVFHSHADNLGVEADDNQTRDIFLRDRLLGTTTRLSIGLHLIEGELVSQEPVIAADARVVAFESMAANLVSLDSNRSTDVFVHVID
jgi:Tol biopolymer transport system component